MKYVRFPVLATALALACSLATVAPASAGITLAASWQVTYYANPDGVLLNSQCINFTRTKQSDGSQSGTFSSTTIPGWSGTWFQRGQHFSFQGQYMLGGQVVTTYDSGDFVSATIAAETSAGAWNTSTGSLFTGTATLTQVRHC